MEDSWGQTLIANYGMVKRRHMHQYGTTDEQFAEISVVTRRHAMRNPEAVKAMTDLEFVGVNEITVEDVVDSRVIAHPLHLLECCMISDGGGAVIIASPEVAANCAKKPAWINRHGRGHEVPRERRRHYGERRSAVRADCVCGRRESHRTRSMS